MTLSTWVRTEKECFDLCLDQPVLLSCIRHLSRLRDLAHNLKQAYMESSERIESEREADNRADARAIFVVFCALVLGAVHYISGWTF